ncbi:MarR family winged helix-turn-helix transcriptional regulator [Kitasatospora terrestris]|uniref:HTH marR-type domain-containing protein n=1 Tax=Kitasatospora terrestris TaxID=258051 RepID=A0ABP9EEI5_9ACTN
MAQHHSFGAAADADGTAARPLPRAGAPAGDDLSAALRQVLTLTQLARAELAERLGMPLTNVEAVEHVLIARNAGAPIGPVELSRRLGVTSAAGTQSVNRLVAEGHLTRGPHPDDRRRQILDVTTSGFEHVMGELAPLLGLVLGAADGLTDEERAGAKRYLELVAAAYRRYLEPQARGEEEAGPGAHRTGPGSERKASPAARQAPPTAGPQPVPALTRRSKRVLRSPSGPPVTPSS